MRKGAWIAMLWLLWGGGSACRQAEAPASTEILWDEWGIPHIFSPDRSGVFEAFGWAQMASHGDLILRLYGQARGRAAEYWGEEYLESDLWMWRMGVPERARRWWEQQTPLEREILESFVRGINGFALRHPDLLDGESKRVLPVEPVDILAHAQRTLHFTFLAGQDSLQGKARRWAAGSNAWAVGPSRSASGKAMLLVNPHLPWSDLFLFYEAHLVGPGLNAYGVSLVGHPILGIAFNPTLGWTHTVNTLDAVDLYALRLEGEGYIWEGNQQEFQVRHYTLKVRKGDGWEERKVHFLDSIHGPVLAQKKEDREALAVRVAGLEQPHLVGQYWSMMTARNLSEFERAVQRLQMPLFTVMYADREGHILHLFGGQTPRRPRGDFRWEDVVPGQGAETLWKDSLTYQELPKVIDPPSGWLQNANDPPWTTTFPLVLDPDSFPPYLAPRFMHFRAQRSARMLLEDESITWEELLQYKHSTRMELADRILDDLEQVVGKGGSALARRALAVLRQWDRSAEAESRGAVLFQAFARRLLRQGEAAFAQPWSLQLALETPDGLRDERATLAALEEAAREVEEESGALDVPWGKIHRLRWGGLDLPANGGPGSLGIFRVVGFRRDQDGLARAVEGDSFVAVVEFGDPVRAQALLTYGNSSRPDSPFRSLQLPLFAQKRLRPVWLQRREIEAHLSRRERLPRLDWNGETAVPEG